MDPTSDSAIESASPRRFRWRTIPVTLLATFGGLYVLGGIFMLAVMAYTTWTGRPLYTPGPAGFDRTGFMMSLFFLSSGSCLLLASRFLWMGRWLLGLAFIGNCIAAGMALRATGLISD